MSSRASLSFTPARLLAQLDRGLPQPERYWVGFSGGLDSTVLLHALAAVRDRLPAPLSAIHIDHALHPGSTGWARHCRAQCAALGVPLTALTVDANAAPGESPEAAARRARYAAIAGAVGPCPMLLTAHHLDDQAETLLLQLLRGAGVEGLAAMPRVRAWCDGWHARPLLAWRREALRAWALDRQLHWIEDPSNAECAADRNYLRNRLLPLVTQRWPAAAGNIARSASLCAEAAASIRAQAQRDLDLASAAQGRRLQVEALRRFAPVEARNVLRLWLRALDAPPLPQRRLHDALDQLCGARPDASVRIAWAGFELRRFRGQVWPLARPPAAPRPARVDWRGEQMDLGPGLGALRRGFGPGGIDTARWAGGGVQVGYRVPGMRCRPPGRSGSRSFKNIAQALAIPPWQRERLPIIFIDGKVAAIANACVCEPFAAAPGEPGWLIEWSDDCESGSPDLSRE